MAKAIGARVAAEARLWLGTPFVWQGEQRGVGCDCKGLIRGVARALGRPEADGVFAGDCAYSPRSAVPSLRLKEGMAATFDPADEIRAGDVLLLRLGGKPGHLAIATGQDSAIHARVGHAVMETRLRVLFHPAVFPLDSIWRWRRGR